MKPPGTRSCYFSPDRDDPAGAGGDGAGDDEPIWNQRIDSCRFTYLILKEMLKQVEGTFSQVKLKTVSDLRYWNPTVGAELRKLEAAALADEMIKLYTAPTACGASYRDGGGHGQAMETFTAFLVTPGTTIPHLAALAEKTFEFPSE